MRGRHREYQGHRNRNAWNVALYLFNDACTYEMVCAVVQNTRTLDCVALRLGISGGGNAFRIGWL